MTEFAQIFKSFSEDPEKVTAPELISCRTMTAFDFMRFSAVSCEALVVNLTQ